MPFRAVPVPWNPEGSQTQLCLGSKTLPRLNVVLILIEAREGLGLGCFVFLFSKFLARKKDTGCFSSKYRCRERRRGGTSSMA